MNDQNEGRSVSFRDNQGPSGALEHAASSRAQHEIQSAMVVAKRFPRDEKAVRDRIKNACTRVKLAEGALYQYSRGGSSVSGPSIRLAEVLAQCYQNLEFGIRELDQSGGKSTVEAFCWDLETNVKQTKVFQVEHFRHTRQGGYALTDPRDIYELVANNGARRLRACILGVIPGDIVDEAVDQCNQTLITQVEITDDTIAKLVGAFAEMGVSKAQIEKRLGNYVSALRPAQYIQLKNIYRSIRDGFGSVSDFFEEATGTTAADLGADRAASENEQARAAGEDPGRPDPEPTKTEPAQPEADDTSEVDAAFGGSS